jgi:transcriptional regulator with XRE-family HTH domain
MATKQSKPVFERPRIAFNARLMAEDLAAKGWTMLTLSQKAGVADMTVIRFLRGERQTAPTAKKLATALGRSIERYLIREAVAS